MAGTRPTTPGRAGLSRLLTPASEKELKNAQKFIEDYTKQIAARDWRPSARLFASAEFSHRYHKQANRQRRL